MIKKGHVNYVGKCCSVLCTIGITNLKLMETLKFMDDSKSMNFASQWISL